MTEINLMREIVDKLNDYNYRYYVLDDPTVSDSEYDSLYDQLLEIEKKTGVVFDDSPTKRVGDTILSGFASHNHIVRLYSLDKCRTAEELKNWLFKVEKASRDKPDYTLEYKYDGLTLNMTYDDGILIRAVTRGNGITGEVVTEQVRTIRTLPLNIPFKGLCEVQGEAIMRLSVLQDYNENAKEALKNARNAAAGAVRNLDPKVTASRKLDVFCYNIGYIEGMHLHTQAEINKFLKVNQFMTGDFFKVISSPEEIISEIDKIDEIRNSLDYLIDGAVVKVNNLELRDELGFTDKFPRWALAYKFKSEEATTILKDVKWQVSRTSKLNPLAVLEPVDIAGATIRHATLNNYNDILKKGVKINSRVFIRRSNDVIPEIIGVAEHYANSKDIVKPTKCPACGSHTEEDGVFIYCTNKTNCAPQIVSALEHFASKEGMDIVGFSEKTAEQFYNELNVRTPSDLYYLTYLDLITLDGFKERKAENLINSIEKSKKPTLSRFLMALGIPNIGKKAARELSDRFKTLDNVMNAGYEDLISIKDFGDIMAKGLLEFFQKERKLIDNLLRAGIEIQGEERKEGVFSGKKIVLTGSLKGYTRSQAAKIIEDNGGVVSSSVSKDVDIVLQGEEAGSKLDKALKLGIEIIDEDKFNQLLQ